MGAEKTDSLTPGTKKKYPRKTIAVSNDAPKHTAIAPSPSRQGAIAVSNDAPKHTAIAPSPSRQGDHTGKP